MEVPPEFITHYNQATQPQAATNSSSGPVLQTSCINGRSAYVTSGSYSDVSYYPATEEGKVAASYGANVIERVAGLAVGAGAIGVMGLALPEEAAGLAIAGAGLRRVRAWPGRFSGLDAQTRSQLLATLLGER